MRKALAKGIGNELSETAVGSLCSAKLSWNWSNFFVGFGTREDFHARFHKLYIERDEKHCPANVIMYVPGCTGTGKNAQGK